MKAKKSFMLYLDSLHVLNDLSNEERGELFYAIYQYQRDGKVNFENRTIKLLFNQFETQFIRDNERYEKTIIARSEAGKKHKGNQYSNLEQNETNGTNVPKMEQNETNGTDNDSVNDNNKDNNIEKDIINNIQKEEHEVPISMPPIKELNINPPKEKAIVWNKRLIGLATQELEKVGGIEENLDSYYRFILYVNNNYSSILYQLRLMEEKKYYTLQTKYGKIKMAAILENIDNSIDAIKSKKQKELGCIMDNWLRREMQS